MQDHSMSVTQLLQPFVDAERPQFVGLDEAWKRFLDYVRARRGTDIRGVQTLKEKEIEAALELADSEDFDKWVRGDLDVEWFSRFESRQDVLTACHQFLKHLGLGIPPDEQAEDH